jgi:predicted outer membrane protein
MNVSLRRAAGSLAVLFSSAALLLAQEATQPAQPRPDQPRAQPAQRAQPGQRVQPGQPGQFGRPGLAGAQAQQLEPSILTLLIIDNNKEIALGQLGQQKSQNEHVKHFCEMIVEDHSNFVQKLQEQTAARGGAPGAGFGSGIGRDRGAAVPPPRPLSPTAGAQPGAATRDAATPPPLEATAQKEPNQPGLERETAATAQDRNLRQPGQETRTTELQRGEAGLRITVAKPVIGNQPGAALLQLHHEVAEKCLESARQEADKLGQEFDIHFMGAQIVAHKGMLDKLQVFQQHVSPETRQLLADAQKTTRKHLEEAQTIHENLSKQGGSQGAETRRGARTETREDRE